MQGYFLFDHSLNTRNFGISHNRQMLVIAKDWQTQDEKGAGFRIDWPRTAPTLPQVAALQPPFLFHVRTFTDVAVRPLPSETDHFGYEEHRIDRLSHWMLERGKQLPPPRCSARKIVESKMPTAGGGNRTHTPEGNTILSRARLPVPPRRPKAPEEPSGSRGALVYSAR